MEIGKFPDEVKLGIPEKFYPYHNIRDKEDKIKYKTLEKKQFFILYHLINIIKYSSYYFIYNYKLEYKTP